MKFSVKLQTNFEIYRATLLMLGRQLHNYVLVQFIQIDSVESWSDLRAFN